MLLSLIFDKPEKQVQHKVKQVFDRQWLTKEDLNKQLFGERAAIWRVLDGSPGTTLKVIVQSLPLKDTYTKPSAAMTLETHLSHRTVFVTALSKTQEKNKAKHKERKWMVLHFSCTRTLKSQNRALYGASSQLSFPPLAEQLHFWRTLNAHVNNVYFTHCNIHLTDLVFNFFTAVGEGPYVKTDSCFQ